MQHLDEIAERIHTSFEVRTTIRDRALSQTRTLTRHCANAIRAVHRDERSKASEQLEEARLLVEALRGIRVENPDFYYAGYTLGALKEYAEANLVFALIGDNPLPTPEELDLLPAVYLQGLAETVGELRRRCLDALLNSRYQEAEKMLGYMDDIYAILVTIDYPDAITGGLRRMTDIARSITERTRGDLTLSLRQEKLERSLKDLEGRLETYDDLGSINSDSGDSK
jgi:translin